MHEMSHALAGVLTCARIESIQLEPNEGGCTRMRGGVQFVSPAPSALTRSFSPQDTSARPSSARA
jgi:hypothetical protein